MILIHDDDLAWIDGICEDTVSQMPGMFCMPLPYSLL